MVRSNTEQYRTLLAAASLAGHLPIPGSVTLRRFVILAALLAGLALAASGAGGEFAAAPEPADSVAPALLAEQGPSR
jgi:hypothetical protein